MGSFMVMEKVGKNVIGNLVVFKARVNLEETRSQVLFAGVMALK